MYFEENIGQFSESTQSTRWSVLCKNQKDKVVWTLSPDCTVDWKDSSQSPVPVLERIPTLTDHWTAIGCQGSLFVFVITGLHWNQPPALFFRLVQAESRPTIQRLYKHRAESVPERIWHTGFHSGLQKSMCSKVHRYPERRWHRQNNTTTPELACMNTTLLFNRSTIQAQGQRQGWGRAGKHTDVHVRDARKRECDSNCWENKMHQHLSR